MFFGLLGWREVFVCHPAILGVSLIAVLAAAWMDYQGRSILSFLSVAPPSSAASPPGPGGLPAVMAHVHRSSISLISALLALGLIYALVQG